MILKTIIAMILCYSAYVFSQPTFYFWFRLHLLLKIRIYKNR